MDLHRFPSWTSHSIGTEEHCNPVPAAKRRLEPTETKKLIVQLGAADQSQLSGSPKLTAAGESKCFESSLSFFCQFVAVGAIGY